MYLKISAVATKYLIKRGLYGITVGALKTVTAGDFRLSSDLTDDLRLSKLKKLVLAHIRNKKLLDQVNPGQIIIKPVVALEKEQLKSNIKIQSPLSENELGAEVAEALDFKKSPENIPTEIDAFSISPKVGGGPILNFKAK